MADVERQWQADKRWYRVGNQVTQQRLEALARCDMPLQAQALDDKAPQQGQRGERADPHPGQQQEIPGHAPRGTFGRLVDQLVHLIRRPVGPQPPGVDQVLVEVEFVLHIIDAGADGAEQAAFYQQFRLGRGSRRRSRGGSGRLQRTAAAEQQRAEQ